MTKFLVLYFVFFFFWPVKNVLAIDEIYTHSIEDEKQMDFPGIEVIGSEKKRVHYYTLKLNPQENEYGEKVSASYSVTLPAGTSVKISGYIIARELMDSIKFKSIGNKTNEKEIRNLLNSENPAKMFAYILRISEKWRVPENDKEEQVAQKKIDQGHTNDIGNETASIATGYIEVMPEKSKQFEKMKDVRFFIPLKDIRNLALNEKEASFKLRKATTLLAFKRLKSNLNFPDLSEEEVKKIDTLESALVSDCSNICFLNKSLPKLGDFIIDINKAISKAAANEKMAAGEEYNLEIMNGLKKMIDQLSEGCPNYKALTL